MKLNLYISITFSFCASLFAATPSFYSFDTNDFTVTPSLTNPLTIHSKGSGGTNVFNTIIVTNLYMTTNTYITINGDTNAAGLWINDNGNYIPSVEQSQLTATNIVSKERLQADGAFILAGWNSFTLDPGLNDISAYNLDVLLVQGFDSDPANSSLRLDPANGRGQLLVIQNYQDNSGFTMRNGEALFGAPPNSYQVLNGDWVTSTKGDSILLYNSGNNWSEIARMSGSTNNTGSSLWESVAGVLRPLGHSLGTNQFTIAESTGWTGTGTNAFLDDGTFGAIASLNPTDGYLPYRFNAYSFEDSPWYVVSTNVAIDSQVIFGPGTTNVLYRNGGNLVYTNGSTTANGVNLQVINGNGVRAMFGVDQDEVPFVRSETGKVFRIEPNNGNPIYAFSSTAFYPNGLSDLGTAATNFQWSSLYLSNQIVWGPGTTNVLYRNGSHLFYTNGAANVDIKINNGSGKTAAFGLNAGGQAELRAEGTANAVSLSNGTDILTLFSNGFYPATYPINLGSTANPWGPNFYMAGFVSGTNYSRLYLNHSGTNGSVVFDSQSSGTAGSPRQFVFTNSNVVLHKSPTITGLPWEIFRNIQPTTALAPYYTTNIVFTNLAAGTNLIFQSPSGMRSKSILIRVATTNTVTTYPLIRISGVDYLTGTTANSSTTAAVSLGDIVIREPGEGFAVYINGNATVYASFFVYTNTIPLYTARILDVNSGNNTLYTCPTNTVAQGVALPNAVLGPDARVSNASGGARAYSFYFVPSGSVAADVFPFGVSASTADLTSFTPPGLQGYSLREGDSIVVNSDSSTDTQSAWITVFENPE